MNCLHPAVHLEVLKPRRADLERVCSESNPKPGNDQPQEGDHPVGNRNPCALWDSSFPVLLRFTLSQPGHKSATFSAPVLRSPFRADISAVRGPDVCSGPQSSKTLRRTAAGCPGLEVPHSAGGWGPAALVLAGHHDVLVRLWADEPFSRQVVLSSGRRGARRYGGGSLAGFEIRRTERPGRGRIHCRFTRDATCLRRPRLFHRDE